MKLARYKRDKWTSSRGDGEIRWFDDLLIWNQFQTFFFHFSMRKKSFCVGSRSLLDRHLSSLSTSERERGYRASHKPTPDIFKIITSNQRYILFSITSLCAGFFFSRFPLTLYIFLLTSDRLLVCWLFLFFLRIIAYTEFLGIYSERRRRGDRIYRLTIMEPRRWGSSTSTCVWLRAAK